MMHPDEGHSPGTPGSRPFKPLTRILGDVQRILVDRCRALLERALLATGKPGSIGGPSQETMAQLQAQRGMLLQRFGETLEYGFQLLVLPLPQRNELAASLAAETAAGVGDWEAPLVEQGAGLRSRLSRDLEAATRRLDHLVLQVEVNSGNNPLEPAAIIRSFVAAAAALATEARAALAVQFQSQLQEGLAPIYQEINRALTEARILPDAEEIAFDPPEAAAHTPANSGRGWVAEVAAPPRPAIESPVPEKPQPPPSVHAVPPPAAAAAAIPAEVAPAARALMPESPEPIAPPAAGSSRRAAAAPGLAGQSSDRVAALCTALFDEIRADPEIPDPVKKEMGKLQLVYTLYALNRAPDFLSKAEHPARVLIELLWDMGRSLNGTRSLVSHPRYRAIVEVVDEIRERKSPSEQDFFQVYCMLLALQ